MAIKISELKSLIKEGIKENANANQAIQAYLNKQKDHANNTYNPKKDGKVVKNSPKKTNIKEQDSDTYFNTFSAAAEYARESAEKKGYEIDSDSWSSQITFGGKYTRSRPAEGVNHTFNIELLKDGKPQRKALTISVYGMPSGKFELTHYIN